MKTKFIRYAEVFLKLQLPLLIIFFLIRIFEYFTIDFQMDVPLNINMYFIILFNDISTWAFYSLCVLLPFMMAYLWKPIIAEYVVFTLNTIIVIGYFSLLIVYSERHVPFDHEIFMRKASEAISTINNVATGKVYFIVYIVVFLFLHWLFFRFLKRRKLPILFIYVQTLILALSTIYFFIQYSHFKSIHERYIVKNKLDYFSSDCYVYLKNRNKLIFNGTDKEKMLAEIDFFQKNHPFFFVDKEFPLLHEDETQDVLNEFFKLGSTPPNVVIIIVESLSSAFCGTSTLWGSFTPFLDSLSNQSLTWINCLSSSQGTFGSAPTILGSLPFGEKGFSLMTLPPSHTSLMKILKNNNYYTYYFTGAEVNFDNYGGFFRSQGCDFISDIFPEKYKKEGVGPEGWSNGYPDDATFNYSLQVTDSIKKTPYLSVYLTLSTHTPYIFDQLPSYEAQIDKMLKKQGLSSKAQKNIRPYKTMFASFLFTDDCLRKFIENYKKRADFANTIFIITGDHHQGEYPTRNELDCFGVPLFIYSPLLKQHRKFQSVNTHFDIAPSIWSLLKNNFTFSFVPKHVTWLGDGLDTCHTFRNIHRVPFMLFNRNIDYYLSDNYFLAGKELYELQPNLALKSLENDSITSVLTKERDNFKFINAYVCQQNKIYPATENLFTNNETFLKQYTLTKEQPIFKNEPEIVFVDSFNPPQTVNRLKVNLSLQVFIDSSGLALLPNAVVEFYSAANQTQLFSSYKGMEQFMKLKNAKSSWVDFNNEDIFNIENYQKKEKIFVKVSLSNVRNVHLLIRNIKIKFSGMGN